MSAFTPGHPKFGGRQKGTRNKQTLARDKRAQAFIEQQVMSGQMMPLDLILGVMRGTLTVTKDQYQAAVDAAPFCHPKLSSVSPDVVTQDVDPEQLSDSQLMAIIKAHGGDVDEELLKAACDDTDDTLDLPS